MSSGMNADACFLSLQYRRPSYSPCCQRTSYSNTTSISAVNNRYCRTIRQIFTTTVSYWIRRHSGLPHNRAPNFTIPSDHHVRCSHQRNNPQRVFDRASAPAISTSRRKHAPQHVRSSRKHPASSSGHPTIPSYKLQRDPANEEKTLRPMRQAISYARTAVSRSPTTLHP